MSPLHRRRRHLVLILLVYCLGGTVSQKVLRVDEIFPFFGWSLFTKVPNVDERYRVLILRHRQTELDPPVPYLRAPNSMAAGNRYHGRKVIQALGRAFDAGDEAGVQERRRQLETNYLRGRVRYELIFESYDPYEKWRTGKNLERRSLAVFDTRRGAG